MFKNILFLLLGITASQASYAQEKLGLVQDELTLPASSTQNSLQYGIYKDGFHEANFVIEADAKNKNDEALMVFPNPAESEIIIKVYDLYKGMIRVQLSTQGILPYEEIFDSADSMHRVSFKNLGAGTYWLELIEIDNNHLIHRFKVRYTP